MTFADIEKAIADFGGRAKENKLKPEELPSSGIGWRSFHRSRACDRLRIWAWANTSRTSRDSGLPSMSHLSARQEYRGLVVALRLPINDRTAARIAA